MGNFLVSFNNSISSISDRFKEKSPTIAIVAGLGGLIFASVYACKKSMELPEVIETHRKAMDEIKENMNPDGETIETTQGTIKASQAAFQVKRHFCWSVVKLYALPVGIAMVSVGLIGWSHCEMNKRYTKAVAAYVSLNELFSRYRDRVRAKYGSEAENEIRYNIKQEEKEEEYVDAKGKIKKRKVYEDYIDLDEPVDDFTAFYCQSTVSPYKWKSAQVYNINEIKLAERWANDCLRSRKRYFINDLLKDLGIDERASGQYVGWIYSNAPDHIGDNCVQITYKEAKFRNPKTGTIEPGYLLEFNADGNILDKAFNNVNAA